MTDENADGETSNRATPDPRVRAARPTDADRIHELQSFLRQPNPELLEYGLSVGTVLVSVSDDHVVGYLLPVDAAGQPGAYIAELAVAPDFRREGRARGLLFVTIQDADGPVTLQAHSDNDAALALYEAVGFEIVGRRAGAYGDDDAVVLRRD